MSALELAPLELAPGLQSLEKFFDRPTRSVTVDSERDCVIAVDWKIGEKVPLDCGLALRRVALEDVDHVQIHRRRLRFRCGRRPAQLHLAGSETPASRCDGVELDGARPSVRRCAAVVIAEHPVGTSPWQRMLRLEDESRPLQQAGGLGTTERQMAVLPRRELREARTDHLHDPSREWLQRGPRAELPPPPRREANEQTRQGFGRASIVCVQWSSVDGTRLHRQQPQRDPIPISTHA
jgi:hypothetical protein